MTKEFSYDDFKKVLDLAKQNADSFEFCMKENEKLVAELKEKLKPFDDDYFRGLTTQDIAELAKESLRWKTYSCDLDVKLLDIKDLLYEAQSKREEFIEKILQLIEGED